MKNYKLMITLWLKAEIEKWFVDQGRNPYAIYYLWYKESEPGMNGKLTISATKPSNEWTLAHADPVSRAWTISVAMNVMREWCVSLPILDPCES